jgi:hypothetical protein
VRACFRAGTATAPDCFTPGTPPPAEPGTATGGWGGRELAGFFLTLFSCILFVCAAAGFI